jgi:[acyl-carrier-protein] S-malonyltransferase
LIVPLKVSGPWHSRFMAGAQEPLRRALDACRVNPPRVEAIANITAAPHPADPQQIRDALVRQIVSPVLWTQSMSALVERGYRTFVEAGPGRVLTGLLKGLGPDIRAINVQDTDTFEKCMASVERPPA